jgi:hypothetical protein
MTTVVFFSEMYNGKKTGQKPGVLGDSIKVAIKKQNESRTFK